MNYTDRFLSKVKVISCSFCFPLCSCTCWWFHFHFWPLFITIATSNTFHLRSANQLIFDVNYFHPRGFRIVFALDSYARQVVFEWTAETIYLSGYTFWRLFCISSITTPCYCHQVVWVLRRAFPLSRRPGHLNAICMPLCKFVNSCARLSFVETQAKNWRRLLLLFQIHRVLLSAFPLFIAHTVHSFVTMAKFV